MGSQEEEAGYIFCFSCRHVINLEMSSDTFEIRNGNTAENFKVEAEIWVSYHCGSLGKVTCEFSEGHEVDKSIFGYA